MNAEGQKKRNAKFNNLERNMSQISIYGKHKSEVSGIRKNEISTTLNSVIAKITTIIFEHQLLRVCVIEGEWP